MLASNHIHWIDIFVIEGSIPGGYQARVAGEGRTGVEPGYGWLGEQAHLVPIRRGQMDKEALVAAETAIQDKRALVIYPEGHRSGTGSLQRGHGGAIALALRTGCPIVPMAVWGTEAGLKGALQRKPIHVQFGKPYYPMTVETGSTREATDLRIEELMLRIAALLPEPYWGFYRERLQATTPSST